MRHLGYGLMALLTVISMPAQAQFIGTDLSSIHKITPKEDGTFKGSNIAAGGTLNTGNTSSLNINASGLLEYTHHQWVDSFNAMYQREQTRETGLKVNRTFLQGQSVYNLDPKQFLYTQLNYTRDKFDGYNYIVNWAVGYGRNVEMPKNMELSWMAGPGVNQSQDINNVKKTSPSVEGAIEYTWAIRSDLKFSENLQSIATNNNVRTISTTGLSTKIAGNLNLELMFQAINDNHPPAGKTGFNTITSLQLSYQV